VFHAFVRRVVLCGFGLIAACAARPLPVVDLTPTAVAPLPIVVATPAVDAGAQVGATQEECIIQGSGFDEHTWSGDLMVRLAVDGPARVKLVTAQVQGVFWTDLPPPNLDRPARVRLDLFGVRVVGWARVHDREMRFTVRAPADEVVWAQPGHRGLLRGARGADAYLEIQTQLAAPKTLLVRQPCSALTTDERTIDPEPAPDGPQHAAPGGLHLHTRENGPIVRRLDWSGPVVELGRAGDWVHVGGASRSLGFDGWVRADELTSYNGGAGWASGRGRMGTRCGASREWTTTKSTPLFIGVTPSETAGLLDAGATLIERDRLGDYMKVSLPPCALLPAIDDEFFWVRAGDVR